MQLSAGRQFSFSFPEVGWRRPEDWTFFGLDFIAHFIAHFIVLSGATGKRRGCFLCYASGERRNLFDIAESAVVRAGTYVELCARTDELDPDQKDGAMALLDRIASMLCGLGSA
jgi:hypothetical protein